MISPRSAVPHSAESCISLEDWTSVHPNDKGFHIGTAQGLMFGILTVDRNSDANEGSLFPNVVGPSLMVISKES